MRYINDILQSSEDEIVLVMDVDMKITWEFLQRVRQNTIKNKKVFYPVSFSQVILCFLFLY